MPDNRLINALIGYAALAAFGSLHLAGEAAAKIRNISKSNGITDDVADTERIKITGLEKDIKKPVPDAEDKKWARKHRDPYLGEVCAGLATAIENNQNWRVLHLINRPYRGASFFGPVHHGFDGNVRLSDALHQACKNDNVTAAYYLFKFAEQKPSFHGGVRGDEPWVRDEEVRNIGFSTLRSAVGYQSDKIVSLIANSAGSFDTSLDYRGNARVSSECIDSYLHDCIATAVKKDRLDYLDLFLKKGARPEDFRAVYADSFGDSPEGTWDSERQLNTQQRKIFFDWMAVNGIADQNYADQTAQWEAAETARKKSVEQGQAEGWSLSRRWTPQRTSEENGARVVHCSNDHDNLVEINIEEQGKKLTWLFNFETASVKMFENGAREPVRVMPMAEFQDRDMAERGRNFLIANKRDPKPAPWAK